MALNLLYYKQVPSHLYSPAEQRIYSQVMCTTIALMEHLLQ